MKDGIADVEFSPDGRWIAFTSRTQHERYDAEDESWQAPRKIETFFTRLNGEGWIFDRPTHVYVVAADGIGHAAQPHPGRRSSTTASPGSPTRPAIVTSAQRHDTWDRDFADDLYLVPLDGDGDRPGRST